MTTRSSHDCNQLKMYSISAIFTSLSVALVLVSSTNSIDVASTTSSSPSPPNPPSFPPSQPLPPNATSVRLAGSLSLLNSTVGDPRQSGGLATLVTNAHVLTLSASPASPIVSAFGFDASGKIIATGTDATVRAAFGATLFEVVDLSGAFVLPGFQDVHSHVPEAGVNLLDGVICAMDPDLSIDEYIDELLFCAQSSQRGSGWLRAAGAGLYAFAGSQYPLSALNAAFPSRPVIVQDDVGHVAWTNSRGAELAGLDVIADAPGGFLGRDRFGDFNGLLFENAQQKVRDAAALDAATIDRALGVALQELARNGITSMSDAGGFWTRGSVEAWLRAERAGTVSVRARNTLYVYPEQPIESQVARLKMYFVDDKRRLVNFNAAKIYIDGILDIGSAVMTGNYDNAPNPDYPSGYNYFSDSVLERYTRDLIGSGFQINFHAIGDGAVKKGLDMLSRTSDRRASRSRLTHTYLVQPADIPRFQRQGVIADFQMPPVALSSSYTAFLRGLIGGRADRLIPLREVYDTGAVVTISTDWDADPLSPLSSIQRAMQREAASAPPSVEDAIRMWTRNAAYALKHDDITGSIEVGKFADYVVLDRNILNIPVSQIGSVRVLQTVLAGRTVYRA